MNLPLTSRDRFALFVHLNGQQVPNRAEGRRFDRVWLALDLDAIAAAIEAKGAAQTTAADFAADDVKAGLGYELSSSARDSLIDYLDKPMQGGIARLLVRVGDALIADRDGPPKEDTP